MQKPVPSQRLSNIGNAYLMLQRAEDEYMRCRVAMERASQDRNKARTALADAVGDGEPEQLEFKQQS